MSLNIIKILLLKTRIFCLDHCTDEDYCESLEEQDDERTVEDILREFEEQEAKKKLKAP